MLSNKCATPKTLMGVVVRFRSRGTRRILIIMPIGLAPLN